MTFKATKQPPDPRESKQKLALAEACWLSPEVVDAKVEFRMWVEEWARQLPVLSTARSNDDKS